MAKKTKMSPDNVLLAVLYIVIGLMFVIFRSEMLNIALTISGILAIAYGIYLIVKKDLIPGIVFAVVGVLLIVGGWVLTWLFLIIVGVALIIYGAKGLIEAIQKKKGLFPILLCCLTIVAGILFIVSKWAMLDWFFIILGIVMIIDGAIALINK